MTEAARSGDPDALPALIARYERELLVHCYRMLGSVHDAQDACQETFLRAWQHLDGFEGRSTVRAWLYRIATNVCLDTLGRASRRMLPHDFSPASDPSIMRAPRHDIAWLEPIPTALLDSTAPPHDEPAAAAMSRETIELAFIAAVQHLAPRQRAVVILRDVLGWPARQTAAALDISVSSANSSLHRARSALREFMPERRIDWTRVGPTNEELGVVRRYMDAIDRGDIAALAGLLAADIRTTMPPWPMWFEGRDHVVRALQASWDPTQPGWVGSLRSVATAANGQPAVALYTRTDDHQPARPFSIGVLTISGGVIVEITAFHDPRLFPAFGLTPELS